MVFIRLILILGVQFLLHSLQAQNGRVEKIDFEDWDSRTILSNQVELRSLGISFPSKAEVIDPTFFDAVSGEKIGAGYVAFELVRNPIEAVFFTPVFRVEIKVRDFCIRINSCSYEGKLIAYNLDGQEIDRDIKTISSDWETLSVISAEGISKVELKSKSLIGNPNENNLDLVFDDLEFEFFPEDNVKPKVALLEPADEYIVSPEGKIDVALEASDDLKLGEVFYEIITPDGSVKKVYVCNTDEPCQELPPQISDSRTIDLTELGFTQENWICELKITAVAIDAASNKALEQKSVKAGWSSKNYNPDKYNIKVFDGCDEQQKEKLQLALDLLIANSDEILKDVTFYRKRGKKMRSKRQKRLKKKYKRKVKKMRKVVCMSSDSKLCEDNDGRSGGLLTRRIKICYDKIAASGFCGMFELFAHESGHMANIPWNRGSKGKYKHSSSNEKDNIYNIGFAARKWCDNNCHAH